MGSQKLYDFVDNNPLVEFHPTEYTNDPFIIAQNDKMISINSAIEVDLTGQVCADSLGTRFYSGIGGQVDFMRGAARSKGGKPIIALPSTADDGHDLAHRVRLSSRAPASSRAAATCTTSSPSTASAYLHGKTVRERALALINIAHPKFRPWLLAEAKARHLVYADQIEIPMHTPSYPQDLETLDRPPDGARAFLRPLKLTDESLLRGALLPAITGVGALPVLRR